MACREAAERAAQQQAAHESRVAAAEAAKQAAQAAATAKLLQDRGVQVWCCRQAVTVECSCSVCHWLCTAQHSKQERKHAAQHLVAQTYPRHFNCWAHKGGLFVAAQIAEKEAARRAAAAAKQAEREEAAAQQKALEAATAAAKQQRKQQQQAALLAAKQEVRALALYCTALCIFKLCSAPALSAAKQSQPL
jgi:hypothetical protein